jgi:hypothetical protein
MTTQHTIQINGAWKGAFDPDFKRVLARHVQIQLRATGRSAVAMLRRKSKSVRWKGRYAEGWVSAVSPGTLVVRNKEQHAIFVENGRRAGARPPPVAAILEWVRDKLGPSANPFVVAQAIGRNGIRPRRAMTSPATQTELLALVEKRLQYAVADALRESVQKTVQRLRKP